MKADRKRELRAILMGRRLEVAGGIRKKIHDVRAEGAEQHNSKAVRNSMDIASDDIQEDIELLLIQMRADTLNRIDQALGRLDQGLYGRCLEAECGEEISESRLRALPFAVRCKDCEEARETAERQGHKLARAYGPLFVDRAAP